MPLAQAVPDEAARKLVDALVTARLLTTSGIEADAQVRLAHQRVLEDWGRARAVVAESADFYRIRADLEESCHKWETGKRRGELLLARGLPLAEAESIVGKYDDELAPEVRAYVRASRQRANRAQMIGWSVAAVFLLVAIGAGIAAKVAFDERAAAEAARVRAEHETKRADRNFTAAKQTVNGLIFNIAQGLSGVVGMKVDTIRRILDTVQKTIDQLIETAPDDPQLLRSRAVMYSNFATTYLAAGDLQDAATAATQSLDIARKLAAQNQGNAQASRDVSISLDKVGDVKLQGGDLAGALAAYQESTLRRVFSPAFQAAQSVLFIHWRVVAAPRGGPAISFLWNDGGAGRAMGSASPRRARNGVGMGPFLCGVCSLRHFRRRSRYSLSIGGVAAEPRGGPAISFFME